MRMPGNLVGTLVLLLGGLLSALCSCNLQQFPGIKLVFFSLFLPSFSFSLFFFLKRQQGHLNEVFTPTICLGRLREVFAQGSFYSNFFSERQQGRLNEVFTPTICLGRLREVFTQGYFLLYFFLFFYDDAQGVAKTEADPFSITSTDFSTVLINTCLERGFL